MTLEQVYTVVSGTGIPTAYDAFPESEKPILPYITIAETDSTNFYADGKVYFHKGEVEVVLHSTEKDTASEFSVENALNSVSWEMSEEWNDDEKCNEITYTFEITE